MTFQIGVLSALSHPFSMTPKMCVLDGLCSSALFQNHLRVIRDASLSMLKTDKTAGLETALHPQGQHTLIKVK